MAHSHKAALAIIGIIITVVFAVAMAVLIITSSSDDASEDVAVEQASAVETIDTDEVAQNLVEMSESIEQIETLAYDDVSDLPSISVSNLFEETDGDWSLGIVATNFEFVAEDDEEEDRLGFGHAVIYVNGDKVGEVYSADIEYNLGSGIKTGDVVSATLVSNSGLVFVYDEQPISSDVIVNPMPTEQISEQERQDMQPPEGDPASL